MQRAKSILHYALYTMHHASCIVYVSSHCIELYLLYYTIIYYYIILLYSVAYYRLLYSILYLSILVAYRIDNTHYTIILCYIVVYCRIVINSVVLC